jgi:dTDP-4-dehydrorhamnose 3,5-epimerase
MIFTETILGGAVLIDIEKHEDERGFFARAWCRSEFEAQGLNPSLAQCNISFNPHKGTLRGLHFQVKPHEEAKLVRCTMGSLFDAIVDLRPDSPTYKKHLGVVLTAENRRMLYVPEGFAHGFLTLEDATEVFYQISEFYSPESQRGVRWNDRAFAIAWPAEPRFISERDRSYPDFDRREKGGR